jgi:cytochrome c oxidase assembly factor CtaG
MTFWEPLLVPAEIVAAGALYARGLLAAPRATARWRAAGFGGGLCVLAVALSAPLDSLAHARFAAHMVQHLLLIVVAAPLFALSAPLAPLVRGLPAAGRRAVARTVAAVRRRPRWAAACGLAAHPLAVWTLHTGVLWAWHLPGPYEAALRDDLVHAVEHLCLLVPATLYWSSLVSRRALGRPTGILSLFATALQGGALGALLTFSSEPWYAAYASGAAAAGLTPLEDQQLAGLIMWVPGGLAYTLASAGLFAAWLRLAERSDARLEAGGPATVTGPG